MVVHMTGILTLDTIQLNAVVESKEEAISKAGSLLVKAGRVRPDYVKGMLEREKTLTTYVGNGISIPHGQFGDLALVIRSGISVLQIPHGVQWDENDKAYLVVGIASQGEDHIQILANLARVLEDTDTARLLAETDDPELILNYLNQLVEED